VSLHVFFTVCNIPRHSRELDKVGILIISMDSLFLSPFQTPTHCNFIIGNSSSHANPESITERIGLFLLNPESFSSREGNGDFRYPLDIVAVHGITGNAIDSWAHDNGCNWIRDILPQRLPGARIFSFGYLTDVIQPLGTGNFDDFARALLEHLRAENAMESVGGLWLFDLRLHF
jgi:hypothetical protein